MNSSKAVRSVFVAATLVALLLTACRTISPPARSATIPGDEIIVAGRSFHTGTRVVTWHEAQGYDAYSGAPTLAARQSKLDEMEKKEIAHRGWNLTALQKVVDQLVLHYDACGVSKV